mgnify:CR=1 FL=1
MSGTNLPLPLNSLDVRHSSQLSFRTDFQRHASLASLSVPYLETRSTERAHHFRCEPPQLRHLHPHQPSPLRPKQR